MANTVKAPFGPAGTMAALALMRPSKEFSVETTGCGCPAGQIGDVTEGGEGNHGQIERVRQGIGGDAARTRHGLKSRLMPAARLGPPKGPFALRVSAIRHGVTGTKRSACGGPALITVLSTALLSADPPPDTVTEFKSGDPHSHATLTVTVIAG